MAKVKVTGGLTGITRTESAMYRWGLTFNERSRLADDTRMMFEKMNDDDLDDDRNEFVSLTTGDVATEEVKTDMTSPRSKSQKSIIHERYEDKSMSCPAPLKKRQLKTMSPMYSLTASDKNAETKRAKNDRDLFRRIIV